MAGQSYRNKQGLEPVDGHRKAIFLKSGDVTLNRFPDVIDGFLAGSALADAAWKAWAFCHPELILPRIDNHLSHAIIHALSKANVHRRKPLCQPNRWMFERNAAQKQ